MTEEQFRSDSASRSELEAILKSKAFREAVEIYTNKRRVIEAMLEANLVVDPIASVRLNNQRVGAEGLLAELAIYTLPPSVKTEEDESEFGQGDMIRKLRALGYSI